MDKTFLPTSLLVFKHTQPSKTLFIPSKCQILDYKMFKHTQQIKTLFIPSKCQILNYKMFKLTYFSRPKMLLAGTSLEIQSGPKKCIHSLLINIFGINLNEISISG